MTIIFPMKNKNIFLLAPIVFVIISACPSTPGGIRHIPVVIFTSSNEEKDRMESYALGANSYLVKPLDTDEFSKYIKQIVKYWVKMNAKAN